MATPSPSPSPPPPPPLPLAVAEPPSSSKPRTTKKLNPVPWTHQETVHLIQAYQEKWYSLKRGQLKANQWEEVAVSVAARCGYDYNHLSKTVIQCRHKMEKLRKRYREERRRLSLNGTCFWQYYDLMDSLERGPLPLSSRPLALIPHHSNNEVDDDEEAEEVEEEEEEEEYGYRSRSLSINYILQKPTMVNRFAGSDSRLLPAATAVNKRKREELVVEEEEEVEGSGKRVELELAGEIRSFTERILGMEKKKIQMMKETEKWKMEMENKRMEMILESQRKIVDMISTAFETSTEDLKIEQQF